MKQITLYSANCRQNKYNTNYPNKQTITTEEQLKAAVKFDHVFAAYKSGHRSIDDFIRSDCLPFDCDNDHSETASEWKTAADVAKAFEGVPFYVVYSRNHMKIKGDKCARPRFHVIFPIDVETDKVRYKKLKDEVIAHFPYFDNGAADAARFFFGVSDPQVKAYNETSDGTLNAFMEGQASEDAFAALPIGVIPEGGRNKTMSRIAGRLVKRFGDSEKAKDLFYEKAELCSPPLNDGELKAIWASAVKFGKKVSSEKGYVPPEQFEENPTPRMPEDYSDVGQAKVFAKFYKDRVRYSPSTDYLVYDGVCWQESKPKAQAAVHKFTDEQLKEADKQIGSTKKLMDKTGATELLLQHGRTSALGLFSKEQTKAYELHESALKYKQFVIKHRDSKYVSATLTEARPMVEISIDKLDADCFLLNTPDYTIDLRKGLDGKLSHRAEDYITKCTAVSPDKKGAEIWEDALNTFFCGDKELETYVQKIAGLATVPNT